MNKAYVKKLLSTRLVHADNAKETAQQGRARFAHHYPKVMQKKRHDLQTIG